MRHTLNIGSSAILQHSTTYMLTFSCICIEMRRLIYVTVIVSSSKLTAMPNDTMVQCWQPFSLSMCHRGQKKVQEEAFWCWSMQLVCLKTMCSVYKIEKDELWWNQTAASQYLCSTAHCQLSVPSHCLGTHGHWTCAVANPNDMEFTATYVCWSEDSTM